MRDPYLPRLLASLLGGLLLAAAAGGAYRLSAGGSEPTARAAAAPVWSVHAGAPRLSAAEPGAPAQPNGEEYRYRGARFSRLVADSYREGESAVASRFYAWLEGAYAQGTYRFPGRERLGLDELLSAVGREVAGISGRESKAQAVAETCARLHRLIKTVLPRFSLDRGYEFRSAVQYGERQCFLQSVLIAGLLQRMGVDAGVAMVYRNTRGQEINNGHAVTLVKLPNGRDLLVDASEHEPFPRQKGLLIRCPGYRYVEPIYAGGSFEISGYRSADGQAALAPHRVRPLDFPYIRSQFWYYRGERAVGGLVVGRQTPAGLQSAERSLRTSVQHCPQNALAVYMLGRVSLAQGKTEEARALFAQAYPLYARCGWVPEGPKQYLARTEQRKTAGGAVGGGE